MVAAIREDILKSIIETIPNKRLGEADEVTEMVDYLVSDKASYINGSYFFYKWWLMDGLKIIFHNPNLFEIFCV